MSGLKCFILVNNPKLIFNLSGSVLRWPETVVHTEQCENCAIASLLAASESRKLRCFDALDHFAAMGKHLLHV